VIHERVQHLRVAHFQRDERDDLDFLSLLFDEEEREEELFLLRFVILDVRRVCAEDLHRNK